MSGPVGRAYAELVRGGELKPDPAQERGGGRARQAGGGVEG